MVVACVSFPFGWNSDEFRKICGPESNRFGLGLCNIRWAYALAIIGKCSAVLQSTWSLLYNFHFKPIFSLISACIDGCILSTLAFILATRHIRLQPDAEYQRTIGAVNNAYITDVQSLAGSGSRKSLNLKPVLLVSSPHIQHSTVADDSISQFSSRHGTNHRFHNPMHHHHHQHHHPFQL